MSEERQIFESRPVGLSPRWDSWLLSVSLHAAFVTSVAVGTYIAPALREITKDDIDPVLERQRKNRKLVWYRYPDTLPAISPLNPESKQESARAKVLSNQQPIVSKADPSAQSNQLVFQPAVQQQLEAQTAPKKFTAPPENRPPAAPKPTPNLEAPPVLSPNGRLPSTTLQSSEIAVLNKPKAKAFVLPTNTPTTKANSPAALDAPPDLTPSGQLPTSRLQSGEIAVLSKPKPKAFVPPANKSGNSTAPANVNGTATAYDPPPNLSTGGTSTGAFSRAAELGDPDFGRKNLSSGLRVPDLMVGAPKLAIPDEPFEIKPDAFRFMPSYVVPMNAGARVIPRAVEPFFANSVVYSLVIPMSKTLLRRYNGDWIAWFSDVGSSNLPAARMQPPVPILKREIREYLVPGGETGVEKRVMLAALITIDGAIEARQFLRDPGPVISDVVRRDLSRWKFFPARRDGKPVAIDVVLEIPYLVPISLGSPPPRP